MHSQTGIGPGFWSWQSIRLRIVLLLGAGLAIHASIRGVLGMALVCMIRPAHLNQTLITDRGFQVDWNLREISAVFMFFYAGNFLSVFGAHYFTMKFGAKNIITCGLLVSVVTTWTVPILIYFSPTYIFTSMLRFLTGLAQGFYIPCASMLIAKWFGENERSTAMAIFTTGNQVGLAVSMYFTAEICKLDFLFGCGWPLSFLIYGFLGVLFVLVWIPYASDQPRQSSQITAAELAIIRDKHNNSQILASVRHETPFTKVLFSPVVLSICLCSFCQSFTIVIISSYLPTLYRSALNLNLRQNAFWSAMPFLVQILSKIVFALLADWAKKRKIDVDVVTKVSNSIASFVPAIFFLLISFIDDKILTLFFLSFGLALTAGFVPGYNTSIVTIAPMFTSAISAYAQGFAQVASILAPIFVGFATENSTLDEWIVIFQVMSAILIFTGIVFIMFGSAKIQTWANPANLRKATALKSMDRSTFGLTQQSSLSLIEETSND